MHEHPLSQQGTTTADDSNQSLLDKGKMFALHSGMDREVIDPLSSLLFERGHDDLRRQLFDLPSDDHRINRNCSDRNSTVTNNRVTAGIEIATGREVHHRVGPPALSPFQLFHFFVSAGTDGGSPHIRVDLGF